MGAAGRGTRASPEDTLITVPLLAVRMSMNAEVMPITPPTLMFISAVSPARSAAGALRFLYSMMPALFISTSSLGKLRLHARCEGGDLSGIRDVALDGVNLRVLRLHLIEHRLAPPVTMTSLPSSRN